MFIIVGISLPFFYYIIFIIKRFENEINQEDPITIQIVLLLQGISLPEKCYSTGIYKTYELYYNLRNSNKNSSDTKLP